MSNQQQTLDGGVSSDIQIFQTENGPIVVKRALEKLKVDAEWRANPNRSHIEVRALRAAAALLGADQVPTVLWEEPADHAFAMTLIDPALRNWKKDLLAGNVDLRTAEAAGRTLGMLHGRSAKDNALAEAFGDLESFRELRIAPFFERVAEKTPAIASSICQVLSEMASRRTVFVHGDFSPKNILARGSQLVVLDFEVAHWGDPAFDLAFCASHLLLKSWRREADEAALLEAVDAFVAAYVRVCGSEAIDNHLTRMVACLVLARIDGDSPVDYRASLDVDWVRRVARRLLQGDNDNFIDALQAARREPL